MFINELRIERKRERDRVRFRTANKLYKRCDVKWNTKKNEDLDKYNRAYSNANNLGLPLATYLKEVGANNTLKPFITPADQETISQLIVEIRALNEVLSSQVSQPSLFNRKEFQKLQRANKQLMDITKKLENLYISLQNNL